MSKTLIDLAIQCEAKKEYMIATIFYEKAIMNREVDLDAFINLMCLYFNYMDHGFHAGNNLPIELMHFASLRGCFKLRIFRFENHFCNSRVIFIKILRTKILENQVL